MGIVKGQKRRCPECGSNKWERIEAASTTLEILEEHLLIKYRCSKCNKEFIAEERTKSRYVLDADRCCNCRSKNVERVSKEEADIELYRCKQCNTYMGIKKLN